MAAKAHLPTSRKRVRMLSTLNRLLVLVSLSAAALMINGVTADDPQGASIDSVRPASSHASTAPATEPSTAVQQVLPIDWRRFDPARPLGERTRTVARLLNTSLRYILAWAERTYQLSS